MRFIASERFKKKKKIIKMSSNSIIQINSLTKKKKKLSQSGKIFFLSPSTPIYNPYLHIYKYKYIYIWIIYLYKYNEQTFLEYQVTTEVEKEKMYTKQVRVRLLSTSLRPWTATAAQRYVENTYTYKMEKWRCGQGLNFNYFPFGRCNISMLASAIRTRLTRYRLCQVMLL